MTLESAIAIVHDHAQDALVVHANGMISRAGFTHRDRPEHFYMIGSMGLASSIGLGLALARPERRVLVLDGDGNVLMNAGALASIAAAAPTNLLHLCFDNGAHASTGGQRTISDRVHLEELARTAGYRQASRVETREALVAALPAFLAATGPAFLLVRIALGGKPGPRVPHEPGEMAARLRRAAGVR